MTQPNWSLLGGNNALANFGTGVQLGQNFQDRRDSREQSNALLDLRRQQEERLGQERQAQAQRQQREDKRADLPLMERLLTDVTPENWGQRVQIAQQYGIDTSQLPQAYDPAWVGQQLQTVKLLNTPQGKEALSAAGKQAQDAGFRPGTPGFSQAVRQIVTASMAQPYTGSQGETRLYTPDPFGGGQVQGAQPYNPDEWEVVEEGGPASAPGNFPR